MLSFVLLGLGWLAAAANASTSTIPIVNTELGTIIGEVARLSGGDQVRRFRGVPFAQPPIGSSRWKPPKAPLPFGVPFHATKWAPSCPNTVQPPTPLCRTCSTRSNPPLLPNSEDCLYLNILTPISVPQKLPVMVFVHGGGGFMGAAPIYSNSSALVTEGVVLVTVQYRLGLLGWLPHDLLSKEQGGISGNYAVHDVISALTWIQKHIHAFGGNANAVTVFGQSFGASMMHYLLLSPSAHGLFHRAVVESGDVDLDFTAQAAAESDVGSNVFANLDCVDLACARNKTWKELMDLKDGSGGLVLPVYNSQARNAAFPLPPQVALQSGRVNAVPVIYGHNAIEGHLNDYFTGEPYHHFVAQYDNATVYAAVQHLLERTSYPQRSRSEIASAAAKLLGSSFYPQDAFSTGYDRVGAIKSDSGPGLAAWLWALEWSMHAPAYIYVFDARAAGAAAMALFGSMHLLELTMLLGDTYIIDRQGSAFDSEELTVGNQLRKFWAHFAHTAEPGSGWSQFHEQQMQAMIIRTNGSCEMQHWHDDIILGFQASWQGYPALKSVEWPLSKDWAVVV